jgi:hypothetical protein
MDLAVQSFLATFEAVEGEPAQTKPRGNSKKQAAQTE